MTRRTAVSSWSSDSTQNRAGHGLARWGALLAYCFVAGVTAVAAGYVVNMVGASLARPGSIWVGWVTLMMMVLLVILAIVRAAGRRPTR
jgi:hypothetical protein